MELLKISDVSFNKRDVIFRQSRLSSAIACILMLAIMGGAYYLYIIEKLPKFIMIWVIFWLSLFFLLAFSMLKKSFKPTNWLMAFDGQRLRIKFRSYLNTHFSDNDIQVLSISVQEIESARKFIETVKTKTMRGGDRTEKFIYLELFLPKQDLSPIKRVLTEESKKMVNGLKYGHCPLIVHGQDRLRLLWGGTQASTVPNINKSIKLMAKSIRIEKELDLGKNELSIEELLKIGKKVEAIQLAQRKYGYTTAQAKEFVEEL